MTGPMLTARENWGDDMPDWVATLAAECAATSQNKVARRIGRSPALVSNVLRRKYGGKYSTTWRKRTMAEQHRFTEAEMITLATRAIRRIDTRGQRGIEQVTFDEIAAMACLLVCLGVPQIAAGLGATEPKDSSTEDAT